MEDASSPEANYLVLDIETKQDPTARALAGGGKGWRIGLEKLSAFAVLTARLRKNVWDNVELVSGESEEEHDLLLRLDAIVGAHPASSILVSYNGTGHDLGVIRRRAARHWLFDLPLLEYLQQADHVDLMRRHTRAAKDRFPSLRDACAGLGIAADHRLVAANAVGPGLPSRKAETDVVATFLLMLFELAIAERDHDVLYNGWRSLEAMIAAKNPERAAPHLEQFLRHAHFRAMKVRQRR